MLVEEAFVPERQQVISVELLYKGGHLMHPIQKDVAVHRHSELRSLVPTP